MANVKKKRRRVNPLPPLLLSLLLAASVAAGLWYYGSRIGLQANQRPAGTPAARSVTLYTAAAPYTAPVREREETPEAPEMQEAPEYDYREILVDEDGILIARVQGKRYKGVLAVVEDPTRLFVGSIPYFGEESFGWLLPRLMEHSGAVLGLNGGGFDDAAGMGRGGNPQGVVIAGGTMWLGYAGGVYDVCAFGPDGTLYVGRRSGQELIDLGVHSAVSFGPALIIDGEMQTFPNEYWEPRSAVGQRSDGSILLLALEGRQVAAQGASLATLAEAMAEYGAVNATNLDGGASTSLIYKDELMNICNSVGGLRGIPTAILVAPSSASAESAAETAEGGEA